MSGFLSTILDTTGNRLDERLKMEQDFRNTQSKSIIDAIHAVDANGNPKLTPEQMEQAWGELENLHKSKGAKQIIQKAREIIEGVIGHGVKPNQAMLQRSAEQTQQGLSQPMSEQIPTGGTSAAPTMPTDAGPDNKGAALPYTPPPPGGRLQPIQQVANAAAEQAPAAAPTLPQPPKRLSMAQIVAAGGENKPAMDIATEKRKNAEWDREQNVLFEHQKDLQKPQMEWSTTTFGPNGSGIVKVNKTTGDTVVIREPQDAQKHYEMKAGTVDGKPINANYDPILGKVMDLQGNDISDKFIPKESMGAEDRYAALYLKVKKGTATPDEKLEYEGMREAKTLTTTTRFSLYNPKGDEEKISGIADIAEQRGLDAALKMVAGRTELDQLSDELVKRGSNVFKSFADVEKVTGQEANFKNIHNNIDNVRKLLPVIKQDPTLTSMALADPETTLGRQLQGKIANKQLSTEQLNLVYGLRTLREDLFGMRQFFGNSPIRSNAQVQIMTSQIPNEALLTTGDPEKINVALTNLERSLEPIEKQFGKFTSIKKGDSSSDYGPEQDVLLGGKKVRARQNLKTGKWKQVGG